MIEKELDGKTIQFFSEKKLVTKGVQAEDYYFMPIHVWQWNNVIVSMFAAEIANKELIPLGEGEDHYLPQQSIRTFVNVTNKEKASCEAADEHFKYTCISRITERKDSDCS
ncbi:hypothetical protein GCM10020331_090080 [Ectobacillus funiculus]